MYHGRWGFLRLTPAHYAQAAADRAMLHARVPDGNGYAPWTLADFECPHGKLATDVDLSCGCFYDGPMDAAGSGEAVQAARERGSC